MAKGSLRFSADPYDEVVKHSYIAKMEKPRQTLETIELLELIINGLQSWVFMWSNNHQPFIVKVKVKSLSHVRLFATPWTLTLH